LTALQLPTNRTPTVPTDITVWNWLFESKKYSPLHNSPANQLGGYTNAFTKERLNWVKVKEYATYLSTALVRKYGLEEQQTVSLFSPNTVWYPVAMYATLRAGMNNASPYQK
jgi:4-coumarate--CoA ligase